MISMDSLIDGMNMLACGEREWMDKNELSVQTEAGIANRIFRAQIGKRSVESGLNDNNGLNTYLAICYPRNQSSILVKIKMA